MIDWIMQVPQAYPASWAVAWSLIKIIALVAPLMICVAYLTLWERKGIGYTQIRPGPNRVGPYGLLTPIADAVKLIFKEIIRPTAASKGLFFLGPGHDHHAGAGRLGGGALRPGPWRWPTSTPACCS